jgi:hypothetical protein
MNTARLTCLSARVVTLSLLVTAFQHSAGLGCLAAVLVAVIWMKAEDVERSS